MISQIPYPFGFELLGQKGLSTYSVMLMIAFLTASFLAPRDLVRKGLNPDTADWSLLIAVVWGIVGSKVFYVLEIWGEIWVPRFGFWDTFAEVFFTWNGMVDVWAGDPSARVLVQGMWPALFNAGGLVFYGGFFFAFAGIYIYLKFKNLPVWEYGDTFMLMVALGYGVGRLGCFVSGDGCFGHASGVNIPLVTWVYGPADRGCLPDGIWWQPYMCTSGVRVWNTPVMESVLSLLLFAGAWFWLRYKNFRPGFFTALFLVYNGVFRFLVEFIRITDAVIPILPPPVASVNGETQMLRSATSYGAHPPAFFFENWHWYGLTLAQITCLLMIVVGATWIVAGKLYLRGEPSSSR